MKSYNRRNFTLLELMFVVAVLVILIGISWVAGSTVLDNQTKNKTKAEIALIMSAVRQYNERFPGSYPWGSESTNRKTANADGWAMEYLDWGHRLSPVRSEEAGNYNGTRPMFIDFTKNNIDYRSSGEIFDPYGKKYHYYYDASTKLYSVWSAGKNQQTLYPWTTSGKAYNANKNLLSDDIWP